MPIVELHETRSPVAGPLFPASAVPCNLGCSFTGRPPPHPPSRALESHWCARNSRCEAGVDGWLSACAREPEAPAPCPLLMPTAARHVAGMLSVPQQRRIGALQTRAASHRPHPQLKPTWFQGTLLAHTHLLAPHQGARQTVGLERQNCPPARHWAGLPLLLALPLHPCAQFMQQVSDMSVVCAL